MRLGRLALASTAAACVYGAWACGTSDFQAKGGALAGGDGGRSGVAVTCTPGAADPAGGVFVDGAAGTDVSCGSLAAPCKTIGAGVAAANAGAGKTTVYVASGTYAESLKLTGALTNKSLAIDGAWRNSGGSFERQCDADPVSLVTIAPVDDDVTVDARGLSGKVTLSLLTLKSKPSAAAGESLYGVFVRGPEAQVALDGVSIQVSAGGDGKTDDPPAQAPAGAAACDPPGTGQPGPSAAPANAAGATSYTQDGFVAASGGAGGDGNAGANGPVGAVADCTAFQSVNTCDTGSCDVVKQSHCSEGGKGGCAGRGGEGGAGGGGAGSSIGVFAWGGAVVLGNVLVAPGPGGAGGGGALGGKGGAGGGGGAAAKDTWYAQCGPGTNGACVTSSLQSIDAQDGGAGGNGSDGAQGSGGAGGDSYCYVRAGGATIAQSGSRCTPGAAGVAGSGAPSGAAGKSGESLSL